MTAIDDLKVQAAKAKARPVLPHHVHEGNVLIHDDRLVEVTGFGPLRMVSARFGHHIPARVLYLDDLESRHPDGTTGRCETLTIRLDQCVLYAGDVHRN